MRFANAPVSYGVFGDITVDGATTTDELLAAMAAAGYHGSELGPPGFFGTVAETTERFRSAGLTAAGAYVPLHTQDDGDILARDLERMDITLDELCAVDAPGPVILADEGDELLLRSPRKNPSLSLDSQAWDRLVTVVTEASKRARERGLDVSFHPHISTYIELPEEIERLLNDTDLGLTYDIGHVVLAGGHPIEHFKAWQNRINHIHIKDVRRDVLEDARSAGRRDFDNWWANVSVPLGTGDSQLDAFADAVRASDYNGWIVVEQDRAPLTAASLASVFADQAQNLRWLNDRFTTTTTQNS